jgi:lactate dehydrogenase-like 2-hydroxyacid dehydrogenase
MKPLKPLKSLIISAKGEASFSEEQLTKLRPYNCQFHNIIHYPLEKKSLIHALDGVDVVALTPRIGYKLDDDFFNQGHHLKAVVVFSTGLDWIDIDAMKTQNIQLYYLKEYCSTTVAEHCLGLMLNFSRKLYLSHLKSMGKVSKDTSLKGINLCGKTLGIIGYGRIGKKIAMLATAFGMTIIYNDPVEIVTTQKRVSLNVILEESDMICLACPYENKVVVTSDHIKRCKTTAYIINISRKQLVTDRINELLDAGEIAGYAIDDMINPNQNLENGVLFQTYHTAWYSTESLENGLNQWVENIELALNGLS